MLVGIDLGTSEVKVVLVDESDTVVASASRMLAISRPRPGWSEQDPEAWWLATEDALDELAAVRHREVQAVQAIGLSGQMHGAVLLDKSDQVLRPAILWNDSRAIAECAELEERCPRSRTITGNLAMPGFTAPKLLWLRRYEAATFGKLDVVLLPKDYVRLHLTGERVTDISDAAGTLWLDVGKRCWSQEMLEASELDRRQLPQLVEGCEPSGWLRPDLARRWGMKSNVVVAGGGADNAASAVGMGCIDHGQSLISLGTSGVVLTADSRFLANPDEAVHSFCHALPGRWYQMSVTLSATACIDWLAKLVSSTPSTLLSAAAGVDPADAPLFLPYLSGERTPHNNPEAAGVFFGLRHRHGHGDVAYAVAEGVAFALADGCKALAGGAEIASAPYLVGGGAQSDFWARLVSSALKRPLSRAATSSRGAATGAARLARLASGTDTIADVCTPLRQTDQIDPDPDWVELLDRRKCLFRDLYSVLKTSFGR
jgi:xylulokinase